MDRTGTTNSEEKITVGKETGQKRKGEIWSRRKDLRGDERKKIRMEGGQKGKEKTRDKRMPEKKAGKQQESSGKKG